ncbi:MAG: hypothetical protein GOVbin1511_55 [Prokaryotic dsDNA virus sp.]|jgi:hypothetical protein|nr:MAG: hypothetical protein GOVbin1511_55 [Prokaryotic dsDNA virus sp.]|tara:strand:+ start:15504 stop:16418 length:915 start_codon:yes stop_codon:yes gene_type:complete
MANETLDKILNVEAADGPFSVGDAVLEQTLRDFIQLQSNTIAIATDLVGVRSVNWLEFKWYSGITGTFDYPLDDVALTDPTKIGTANYSTKLEKGQGRVTFLDAVRLRGESWENIDRQQLAIVRARADVIDNTILTALVAGSGNSDIAATAVFGSGSADEEGDILKMMDSIFANGKVSGNEPLALVLPADKRSAILNTTLYGNVVESLGDHLARIANLRIYYTRDYGSGGAIGNDSLMLIPGAETAEFFTYNGEGFTETELTRIPGLGFDWLLTSYMGTVIHEHQDGAASGKNNRMVKLTGVRS